MANKSIITDLNVTEDFKMSTKLEELTYVAPSVVIPRSFFNQIGFGHQPLGLFAKTDMLKTTLIGAYEGVVVDWAHLRELEEDKPTTYVIWDRSKSVSHSKEKGIRGQNALRFANHQIASDANMLLNDFLFFASRNINKDEELTWTYGSYDNNFQEITPKP